ncbi:PHD finger protein 14-like [Glandiceps talaboti]
MMSGKKSQDDDVDDGVGFLYKTMLSRDPKKRRIKPVEKHLIQVAFGDDSEDDSDFDIREHHEDDDISGSSDADSGGHHDNEESSSNDTDSDDDDDEDEDEEDEEEEDEKGEVTIEELIDKAKSKQQQIKMSSVDAKHYDKMKVLICSVCLGDNSDDDDEIIECDSCGVPVHEGCYGACDTDSTASNQTSSSTEPWFCDACKAGITAPMCEMCPNPSGIYKETDAGRWVHVVCSLYIPGVTFGDVDKLSPVVLSEVPYSRWGARECCYCEDERFAKTGIVIGCDAGMCRNYFHVTCAQKVGLLSEASPEEDIADPFYAYCKLHVEKLLMKQKRQHWLAVQSHCKQHKLEQIEDLILKERIQSKLERSRERYKEMRKKRPPPWIPSEKMPRLLSTCPSAYRKLMKKAELLGINTETVTSRSSHERRDQRGKWRMTPTFTAEFVNYYLERNIKTTNLKVHLDDLIDQSAKLQRQQQNLREKYDTLSSDIETLKSSNVQLRNIGEELWNQLSEISGKNFPLPPVLMTSQRSKVSPTRKETPKSPTMTVIHVCGLCEETTDQHLLALCDTCKKYYHLGCLDPPLSRMPKKTTYSGWQCSECCSSESDASAPDVVMETPQEGDKTRRSRRQIREPNKFTPIQALYIDVKKMQSHKGSKRKKYKKGFKAKRKLEPDDDDDDEEDSIPPAKKERQKPAPRKPRDVDKRTECDTCHQSGDNSTLVRCDECKKCYHFGCLDPPCKKSPKQAGYMWLCEECDSTPTDDSDEDNSKMDKDETDDESKGDKGDSDDTIDED